MIQRPTSSPDSPSLWRVALDHTRDAAIVIDDAGNVCLFNRAAERIWGICRTDIVGRHAEVIGLAGTTSKPTSGVLFPPATSNGVAILEREQARFYRLE